MSGTVVPEGFTLPWSSLTMAEALGLSADEVAFERSLPGALRPLEAVVPVTEIEYVPVKVSPYHYRKVTQR